MAKYRDSLPQLGGETLLTDGGLETTLVFHEGIDLPEFAAFVLLDSEHGVAKLRDYYRTYCNIAKRAGRGFVLETPTWRSSLNWGEKIGYSRERLASLNRRAVELMAELRAEFETPETSYVISGCIGPEGDGYSPERHLTADQAAEIHSFQAEIFKDTDADMITAITMTYAGEAAGVARAAKAAGMPVAISFTLETDGRLASGQPLGEAIAEVDGETGDYPAYYMINCAHPTHFESVLDRNAPWAGRIRGLRANASKMSHAELDNATELDTGNPRELACEYVDLKAKLPALAVLGGCCGTDHRHVAEIAKLWAG